MSPSISYNFSVTVLSRLIVGVISLIITTFLTRALGPEGYGQYSLILAYWFIFIVLTDFGLYSILTREISQDSDREQEIVGNIFSLRLFTVLGLAFLAGLVSWFFPYPREVRVGILVVSVFGISSSIIQVLAGVFQKHLRVYFLSLADIVSRVIQLVLVLAALKKGASLLGFVGIIAVSEFLHVLFVLGFSRRLVKISLSFNFSYWIKTIKNSLPIAISLALTLVYFKIDTLLLSLMKPAYDVGIYSAAYKVLEVVIFLPAAYVGLIMPLLSKFAKESWESFDKLYRRSFNILSILAWPTVVYLFSQAPALVKIIGGDEFGASVAALRILSPAILLIFLGSLGGNALIALNLQKKGIKIYLAGAVVNLVSNVIFIPHFSYLATAGNTVLTELLVTLGLFGLIKNKTRMRIEGGIFSKSALAALGTAIMIYYLKLGFGLATISFLLYFPILFVLRGFSWGDVKALTRSLRL